MLASLTNETLLRALTELPHEQQECLIMRFLQGLSIAETAQVLGRSDGAVKQLQLRGVRSLAAAAARGAAMTARNLRAPRLVEPDERPHRSRPPAHLPARPTARRPPRPPARTTMTPLSGSRRRAEDFARRLEAWDGEGADATSGGSPEVVGLLQLVAALREEGRRPVVPDPAFAADLRDRLLEVAAEDGRRSPCGRRPLVAADRGTRTQAGAPAWSPSRLPRR